MKVKYGSKEIELSIPESALCFDLHPRGRTESISAKKEILDALRNPIGSLPIREIVGAGDTVMVIADDNTRITPTRLIIPLLLDELNAAGINDRSIQLLIAGGSHRLMNSGEIKEKFGEEVLSRIKVTPHDYTPGKHLADYGLTKRGVRIWINRRAMEADVRIGVGSILPHLPAGWAGGAKIVLPGVAGKESVGQLHLLGASDSTIRLGQVETSFREEIEEFAARIGLHFIVNSIFDRDGNIARVVAGDFIEAHRKGVDYAREVFEVKCGEKADITVASTYPIDFDFFQADKGIFSAVLGTKEGGEIVLLSPCYEGIGPHMNQFSALADLATPEILERVQKGEIEDVMAASEVIHLNAIKDKFEITIVSEGLSEAIVRRMGCRYVPPPRLRAYIGQGVQLGARIGILHQSAEIFPRVVVEKSEMLI